MDTEPCRNRDRGRNFLPMARPTNRPVFSPHRRAAPDLRNADLRARPGGAAGRDGLYRPRVNEPVGPRAVAAADLRAPLQPQPDCRGIDQDPAEAGVRPHLARHVQRQQSVIPARWRLWI